MTAEQRHFCILACDLDDTLLRADKTISEYDKFMLNLLQKSGVSVVFSSGMIALKLYSKFCYHSGRICTSIVSLFKSCGLNTKNAFAIGFFLSFCYF